MKSSCFLLTADMTWSAGSNICMLTTGQWRLSFSFINVLILYKRFEIIQSLLIIFTYKFDLEQILLNFLSDGKGKNLARKHPKNMDRFRTNHTSNIQYSKLKYFVKTWIKMFKRMKNLMDIGPRNKQQHSILSFNIFCIFPYLYFAMKIIEVTFLDWYVWYFWWLMITLYYFYDIM